jgi:hypothetical protein
MSGELSRQSLAELATGALVFVCGVSAGHFAQQGMNELQWAGAAAAVLGSITVAVAVRVWPLPRTQATDEG